MKGIRHRYGSEPDPPRANSYPSLTGVRLLAYHDGPGLGGSEMVLSTLLNNLDPSIDVVIVGDDPFVTRWFADHVPSARVILIQRVRDKWDIRGMLVHLKTIRRLAPDILHINLQTPWSGRYGIVAGLLLRRTKVVAVEHTAMPPDSRPAVWAKRFLMRTTAANVAVSNDLARWIEEIARLRKGSVRVIYNGVPDLGPAQPSTHTAGPPVVGTIARLTWQKGVDVFLLALAQIPNAGGVIVGDGEDRAQLERLAKDLGIDDRLTWMGWRDDARALLASFDIFVLASRFEGLGLVLVEAALAERPIVATCVDGTPEAVVDGETGILVPRDDPSAIARAIMALLADRDRAREMGQQARILALERFDPAAMARAYGSLYADLLGGRLHPRRPI